MVAIIALTATTLNRSLYHLLWGLPVIAVSLLDIYFLSRSLLQKPKTIDTRISSLLIGLGTTFGFSVAVMVLSPQQACVAYATELRQLGVALSLMPYPLVIWALFCLGDCLTVVPEAHAVVAHGPYKFSRHPLYVCYMTWALANVLMFPTLLMLGSAVLQIAFLQIRLRREEALLLETFPEYRQYYERTGLIGPRLRRLVSTGN
jgi:protein-S-isoprenylcysteine O-methyltransferase Ste14